MTTQQVSKPIHKKKKWKWLLFLVVFVGLIGLFSYFFVRVKRIDAGHVGVKSGLSNPVDNTSDLDISIIKGGYVVYMPMNTDVTTYPTTVQTVPCDSITFGTSDGVRFVVKPRVSYQLDENNAPLFYKTNKGNLEHFNKNYLKEIVSTTYSSVGLGFESDSLIHNMVAFEDNISHELSAKMVEMGLILRNINTNLEIPSKIKELVDKRNIAKHNALLAQDKFLQEYIETNTRRVKDSLLNSALTNLAIQKLFIEKWDGRLSIPTNEFKIYRDINRDEADERKEK